MFKPKTSQYSPHLTLDNANKVASKSSLIGVSCNHPLWSTPWYREFCSVHVDHFISRHVAQRQGISCQKCTRPEHVLKGHRHPRSERKIVAVLSLPFQEDRHVSPNEGLLCLFLQLILQLLQYRVMSMCRVVTETITRVQTYCLPLRA